jgi:hypothetical protein
MMLYKARRFGSREGKIGGEKTLAWWPHNHNNNPRLRLSNLEWPKNERLKNDIR